MNNTKQDDPLAMFRPQHENEKPDMPDNDPLFSFRPESEQKRYKEPIYQPQEQALPGGKAPWWEKFGQAAAMQSRMAGAVEPQAAPTIAKAGLSGSTLGASELIPGLEVGEEYPEIATAYKMGSELETIGGLHKLFSGPLIKIAQKSPWGARALSSLADMMGWGATGATTETLKSAFQGKMPSAEDVLTHGAEWAALDAILKTAGLGGKFASWLTGKSKATKQPSWDVINNLLTDMKNEGIPISSTDRVTAKVLSEFKKPIEEFKGKEIKLSKETPPTEVEKIGKETLEKTQEEQPKFDLEKKKIEPIQFKTISENSEALSEPYKPGEIDVESSMQEIEKSRADELVEQLGERAETEKKLGENIKADIESRFKEAENVYTPLYREVEESAKSIIHKPTNTIKVVNDILEHINSLKTRPTGYSQVINTLNDTLSDMGYHIAEVRNNLLVRDAAGNPIKLKGFAIQEEVPLSKTMELARRLNKIADYDIVGPSIKNQLKPVVNSLKREIKGALEEASPGLHKKFIEAEKSYAETAKKFGTDAISGIRGQQATEKIAAKILEPSTLENLKKIVNPDQYNEIQREILQHLRDMPFEKARRTYKEIAPFLDKPAQDAGRSIISHKAPRGKFAPAVEIKGGIIADLNKAFTTGKRPEKVLDLWKTIKGQKLIEEALEGTPNKKEILEYLRKQSFYDFATSIVEKSGEVNFKKLADYLKDPATVRNLHLIGGDEAVRFFKSVKGMANGIKFNVNMLERLPKVELRPKAGKYMLGEERLEKGAEKIRRPTEEVQKFKEIFPEGKPEKLTYGRAERKLKEAAKKKAPFKFKLEELKEKFGISPTVYDLLKIFGVVKMAGPVAAGMAARMLYKIATKPSVRNNIKRLLNASKKSTHDINITPLVLTLSELSKDLKD